jgi:hypothetical protein
VELVCRLLLGFQQAVRGGFRGEVALLIREAHRQLSGREFWLIERQLEDLLPHLIRDAVPDPTGPRRAVLQGVPSAGLEQIVPPVEGGSWEAELLQGAADRQIRRMISSFSEAGYLIRATVW